MGYNPFRPINVADLVKSRVKIACWDTWGSILIVACADGTLRLYEPESSSYSTSSTYPTHASVSASCVLSSQSYSGSSTPFRETVVQAKFGKVIEQIHVVTHREDPLLLMIVDATFRVYSLPDFRQIHEAGEKAKGCFMFAVNKDVVPIGGGSSNTTSVAVNMSSAPSGRHIPLCLAVALKKKSIAIFQWDDNSRFVHFADLVVPDLPRALEWAGSSLVVGLKKDYVLIKIDGSQVDLFQFGKKCFATLLPDKEMLLLSDARGGKEGSCAGVCVDYEGKPTRKEPIVMSDVPQALCYQHPFVVAVLPNCIEVRNIFTQRLSQTLRIPKGAAITRKEHIFVATPNAIIYLAYAPLKEQIAELCAEGSFKETIAMVEISSDACWAKPQTERPAKVKELYALYSYHLFNKEDYQEAMRYFQQTDLSPRQILDMFPAVLPVKMGGDSRIMHPVPVRPIESEASLLRALAALIPYLDSIRSRLQLNPQSYPDPPDTKEPMMPLPVLVDTVLLKAYLLASDKSNQNNLVMPFLEREGGTNCDIDEAQNMLRLHQKFEELVCLYRSRGDHRSALDELQQLGKDDKHMPMAGTGPTVKYLQQLVASATAETKMERFRLALDFSKWVLKQDPEEGLLIFTHGLKPSDAHSDNSIPPELALDHLKKNADAEVCIAYLEALIKVGEKSPMFHNELIFKYFDQVKAELEFRRTYGKKKDIIARAGGEREGEFSLTGGAGHEPGKLGILRSKLLKFLGNSQHYTPEKMLTSFPDDDLLEERAILLSRVRKHMQALKIYAHQLRLPDRAEKYCEQYYNAHSEDEKDMYLYLLEVYLKPDIAGISPNLEASIRLLTKYYNYIDSTKALELLPRDVPLCQVMMFLSAVLCKNKHTLRNNQVAKELLKAENLHVRAENLKESRKKILIDNTSSCPRCGKKIGNSAFARTPNGGVMHYICSIAKEAASSTS